MRIGFRLGRRGAVLVLFGVIYGLIGINYIQGNLSPTGAANLHLALRWMPIQGWGVVWVVGGCLALIASHWPPGKDWWGYGVLSALSVSWCAFSGTGALYGAHYWLSGVLVYACLTAVLLMVASWPEVQ